MKRRQTRPWSHGIGWTTQMQCRYALIRLHFQRQNQGQACGRFYVLLAMIDINAPRS